MHAPPRAPRVRARRMEQRNRLLGRPSSETRLHRSLLWRNGESGRAVSRGEIRRGSTQSVGGDGELDGGRRVLRSEIEDRDGGRRRASPGGEHRRLFLKGGSEKRSPRFGADA